jgi:hypothetical protein
MNCCQATAETASARSTASFDWRDEFGSVTVTGGGIRGRGGDAVGVLRILSVLVSFQRLGQRDAHVLTDDHILESLAQGAQRRMDAPSSIWTTPTPRPGSGVGPSGRLSGCQVGSGGAGCSWPAAGSVRIETGPRVSPCRG